MRRDFNPVRRAHPVEGVSAGILTGQVLRTLLGVHHVRPATFSQAVPLSGPRGADTETNGSNESRTFFLARALHYCSVSGGLHSVDGTQGCLVALWTIRAPWRRRFLMFKSSDYSELAGSLATVAIASLGGPLSAVGAVLAGVVKHAQGGYEAAAPTRDLRRQVSAGIRQWAASEKFATEEVNRGLALAVELVARSGPDVNAIAALNFDPR